MNRWLDRVLRRTNERGRQRLVLIMLWRMRALSEDRTRLKHEGRSLRAAAIAVAEAHARVIGYVTPGHPLMEERLAAKRGELGPDDEAYPPDGFSEWHAACRDLRSIVEP